MGKIRLPLASVLGCVALTAVPTGASSTPAVPSRATRGVSAAPPAAVPSVAGVLVYSTQVGGSAADEAVAVAVDAEGAVYVAGWARSADFPSVPEGRGGVTCGKEAVVFKLAPDGESLLWATYVGGRGDDVATALRVGDGGRVLVAGHTLSGDFPTTEGCLEPDPAGGLDGFVLELSADDGAVVWATRLGGSSEDVVAALELGPADQITVAGTTRSRDFPVTTGSFCDAPRGGRDAFVARLDAHGRRLLFSTRLGGSEDDEVHGLALDGQGSCYVTGRTSSHDFPTTLGAFDREHTGPDAFVTKLSAGGRTLLYSTFLGGGGQDEAAAIAVDALERAVVVGWTQSRDFPFGDMVEPPGRKDAFVVRLSAMGNALEQTACIGGNGADRALGVALDGTGAAWVVGATESDDLAVTPDAHSGRAPGAVDAFVARLSVEDGKAAYLTYVGHEGQDELRGVHVGADGSVAVCGLSSGVPGELRGPLAGGRRGPADALVLRLEPGAPKPVTRTSALQVTH